MLDALIQALDQAAPQALRRARRNLTAPLDALCGPLLAGPAARESLLRLRRLLEVLPLASLPTEERALGTLAQLLSSGPELARLLCARPARLELVVGQGALRPWSKAELRQCLAAELEQAGQDGSSEASSSSSGSGQFAELLARFRNDQILRLAASEFSATPLEQVGRELADLADVCLESALAHALLEARNRFGAPMRNSPNGQVPCGLCAIAMGKYGAQELNFCSDIDLVFIYDSDDGAAGTQSLHEFFSGVCRQVVRDLSDGGLEGFAFRVDLRLRPEGSRGPICNSIASAERYYETWGGPYDRLAWLKARSAAGETELGQQLIRLLQPFVFPRALRPEIVDDLQELTRRNQADLARHALTDGWNVKLGAGGIRDVEFFVQALQLLHAGKLPNLQERSTLGALRKLLAAGLISDRESRDLAEAYDLLRRLEHRLQLYGGQQTHTLPGSGSIRQQIIHHLGYTPEAFQEELLALRHAVEKTHATLQQADEAQSLPLIDLLVARDAPEADIENQLRFRYGFRESRQAWQRLCSLRDKPWGPLGRSPSPAARRLRALLLSEISECPDPDRALLHWSKLAWRCGPVDSVWRFFSDHPPALRLLCSLLGTSNYLASLLVSQPRLFERLLLAGRSRGDRSAAELSLGVDQRVRGEDPESVLEALRELQNEELLRIGLHDIAGDLQVGEVLGQLAGLATLIVERVYEVVYQQMVQRYGYPRDGSRSRGRLAVLALGKLGEHRMSYASDIDLIFVYTGAGRTDGTQAIDAAEFFSRLAQRLINALAADMYGGRLYRVDTRLRPSGQQGSLIISFDAFCRYHLKSDQIWEQQALLKLRSLAGSRSLGSEVEQWVREYLKRDPDQARLAREVRDMRSRIQDQLGSTSPDIVDFKHGAGGLLDIEFAAQFLALSYGTRHPELHRSSTEQVIETAQQQGLVSEEDSRVLRESYAALCLLQNRVRLVRGDDTDRLRIDDPRLEVTARSLGFRRQHDRSPAQQLWADCRQRAIDVRRAFQGVFQRHRSA